MNIVLDFGHGGIDGSGNYTTAPNKMHYLYVIENKINGKLYIGIHSTNNLGDGYMGSGVALKSAINKYGIDNFEKQIIEFFDTREDALIAESIVVNQICVESRMFYNLKEGGLGNSTNDVSGKKNPMYGVSRFGRDNPFFGKKHSNETKELLSRQRKGKSIHSLETRRKMSETRTGVAIHSEIEKQKRSVAFRGSRNPMYGITKGNHPSAKPVIHLDTGFCFDSLKGACESLNIKYTTAVNRIRDKSTTNSFCYV